MSAEANKTENRFLCIKRCTITQYRINLVLGFRPPVLLQPAVAGPGHDLDGGRVVGGHGQHQHVHLRDRARLHHDGARGQYIGHTIQFEDT